MVSFHFAHQAQQDVVFDLRRLHVFFGHFYRLTLSPCHEEASDGLLVHPDRLQEVVGTHEDANLLVLLRQFHLDAPRHRVGSRETEVQLLDCRGRLLPKLVDQSLHLRHTALHGLGTVHLILRSIQQRFREREPVV